MENKTSKQTQPPTPTKPKKKIIVKKKSPEKDKIKKINTTTTVPSTTTTDTTIDITDKYLSQLSDIERKTMSIAENHLQSSFSLEKSIGFLNFVDSQPTS